MYYYYIYVRVYKREYLYNNAYISTWELQNTERIKMICTVKYCTPLLS